MAFFMVAMALALAAGPGALAQGTAPMGDEAASGEMSGDGSFSDAGPADAGTGDEEGAAVEGEDATGPASGPKEPPFTIPERFILVDPANGLAIGGYDPVAFFVDHRARPGRRQFELVWSKTIWTFVNEGNLAIFKDAPQIYVPQFGGHDAQALADGRMAPGNPRVWAIYNQRLYFFHSPERRFEWLIAPEQHVREAEAEWDKRINVRFGRGKGG